jgi:hypothetical protein
VFPVIPDKNRLAGSYRPRVPAPFSNSFFRFSRFSNRRRCQKNHRFSSKSGADKTAKKDDKKNEKKHVSLTGFS